MKNNRFEDHILIETHLKEGDYNLDVWDFKQLNSNYTDRVRFINSCGTLTVNGDFGNWVFNREFHPSKDGKVSRGYWDEKLQIASVQKSHKFSTKQTKELLAGFSKQLKEDGYEDVNEYWIEDLESSVYDELDYTYIAYRQNDSDIDYESIPFGEKRHVWLDIIYDAFNEICRRYE